MINEVGKWLMICGVGLFAIGLLLWIGLPLGKLPGDFHVRGGKSDVYIPLASCILISIALTLFLNLIFWLIRK
jgi:hypothetical protein